MSKEEHFNRIKEKHPGLKGKNISLATVANRFTVLYKKGFLCKPIIYTFIANTAEEFQFKIREIFEGIINSER